MKTLILHNNNLPKSLINACDVNEVVYPSRAEILGGDYDLDEFLHRKLRDILIGQGYAIIFIPYTLSNDDYLQFTGLTVALHIRLTPNFEHIHVPIVFVGPETTYQVSKLTELADILYTPDIFFLKDQTVVKKQELEEFIAAIKKAPKEQKFEKFLERINVRPPSKYASYHSLANEWGIKKMADLFNRADMPKALIADINNIENGLGTNIYFKYLEAKLEQPRKKIHKKKQDPAIITGIENKKIVYIDDEHNKGWGNLLKHIFESSGAELIKFDDFQKGLSKKEQIAKIHDFLDNPCIADADMFLIDLRLCDSDFENETEEEFSGLQLIDFLTAKNKGNQVVIFTASNKIWNLKSAYAKGAAGYTMKESPELNYSREETRELFNDFAGSIKNACARSFLRAIWQTFNDIKNSPISQNISNNEFSDRFIGNEGWLDQIFSLLKNGNCLNFKQILVIFTSILETIADNNFTDYNTYGVVKESDGSEIKIIDDVAKKAFFNTSLGQFEYQKVAGDVVHMVQFYGNMQSANATNFRVNKRITTINKIISVLGHLYSFTDSELNKIIELKYLRDNIIAHGINNVDEGKKKLKITDILFMVDSLRKIFV